MILTTPSSHLASVRDVHPSQRQAHVKPITAPLYVVTVISNPQRFRTRYELFRAFEKQCLDAGAIPYTVEMQLRDRHFEVTEPDNPCHIQLRNPSEIWHKENLVNIGIRHLPADWEYVAWVDADVVFARPDWVNETLHQLQHYNVVQMWSHAQDMGPNFEPIGQAFESFLYSIAIDREFPSYLSDTVSLTQDCAGSGAPYGEAHGRSRMADGHLWHSGYAWAARRSAISDVGGLGDLAVLGSADHHMAAALVGKVERTIHHGMSPAYKQYWERWQALAMKHIKGNVGYVPGTLLHNWHGAKRHRKYVDRWKILVDHQYDPGLDITRDVQGLITLTDRLPGLRDDIRRYFQQRNEDSVDV